MKRLFCLVLAVLLITAFLMNTVIACADSRSGINISNLSKSITKGEIKKVLGKPETEDKKGFDYTWMEYKNSYFCGLYCSLIELYFRPFTETLMQVYIETDAGSYNEDGIFELVKVMTEKHGRPEIRSDSKKTSDWYIWNNNTTSSKFLVIRDDGIVLATLAYDWYEKRNY